MRVLFMGSADIACSALEMLMRWSAVRVVGVVSQPDRPGGRKLRVAACPAKAYATTLGVEIFTPPNVNDAASVDKIRSWAPDVGVVLAYGQILRQPLLDVPALGCINVHTSLLPAYRGAAPIQRAIANGDMETGVTIMQMDAGMDSGPILAQARVPIGETQTAASLQAKLGAVGAAALRDVLADLAAGRLQPRPQPMRGVTFAPRLQKREGRLDWSQPARMLYNRVRGFTPWPGTYCCCSAGRKQHTVRILEAEPRLGAMAVPGQILATKPELTVACGEGALVLRTVQPEGGRAMPGADYARGRRLQAGDRLL